VIELLVSSLSNCEFGNVVDIGCGNFELLEVLRESKFKVSGKFVGVDPVPRSDVPNGIEFINDYFSPESLVLENFIQPDLICMDNVLEHIDELQNFMSDLSKWTSKGDIILVCVPSYELMLKRKIFSEISHEHCNYFSVESLSNLFSEFGFETIAESSEVIHSRGYNFHLFKCSLDTNIGEEEGAQERGTQKIARPENYLENSSFEMKFKEFRDNLKKSLPVNFSGDAYGVGASELTPTLAYFLENDFSSLKGIYDSTPSKFYKFMPGIRPPILPWDELTQIDSSDNLVVLAPSVASEISATLSGMNFRNIWVPDFGDLA
jgi:cyclopropane-fatty-acyl-phospholipid synthase